MPRADWQFIPTSTLDKQKRDEEAAAWAAQQRKVTAQSWADAHTQDFLANAAKIEPAPPPDGPFHDPHLMGARDDWNQPAQDAQGGLSGGPDDSGAGLPASAGTAPNPIDFQGQVAPDAGPLAPKALGAVDPGLPEATSIDSPFPTSVADAFKRSLDQAQQPDNPGLGLGPARFFPAKDTMPPQDTQDKVLSGQPLDAQDFVSGFTKAAQAQQSAQPAAMEADGLDQVLPRGMGHLAGGPVGGLGTGEEAAGISVARAAGAGEGFQRGLEGAVADAAPASRRMFHGTASDIKTPDPEKFDDNGLFGPAFYLTSEPKVAGNGSFGRLRDETPQMGYAEQRAEPVREYERMQHTWQSELADVNRSLEANPGDSYVRRGLINHKELLEKRLAGADITAGPNVRPVDVPENLNLLNAEAKVPDSVVTQARDVLSRLDQARGTEGVRPGETHVGVFNELWRATTKTGNGLYDALEAAMGHDKSLVNKFLNGLGYDGVEYGGGRLRPMMDSDGKPITHQVVAVFGDSLPKIKNALTGAPGGIVDQAVMGKGDRGELLARGLGAVAGGGLGQNGTDENTPLEERIARAVLGAEVGTRFGAHVVGKGGVGSVLGVVAGKTSTKTEQWIAHAQAVRYGSMLSDWVARGGDVLTGLYHTAERPVEHALAGYPKAAVQDAAGTTAAIPAGVGAFFRALATGESKFANNKVEHIKLEGPLAPITGAVTRGMAATDDFIKTINFAGARRAEGQKIASQTGLSLRDVLTSTDPDIKNHLDAAATKAAQLVVYGEDAGAIPEWLAKGRNLPGMSGVAASFVIPFMRVGANISRRSSERFARGLVVPGLLEAGVKGVKGDAEGARYAVAKTLIASGLAAMWASEAAAGHLVGDLGVEKNTADDKSALGQRSNSWNVMGSGRYVDLAPLGEVGQQAIIIANSYKAAEKAYGQTRRGEPVTVDDAAAIVGGIARGLADNNYVKPIADTLGALAGISKGESKGIERFLAGLAGSAVPVGGTLNRIGKTTDPYERDTRATGKGVAGVVESIGNQVKARIPGERQTLPIKQDVLGRDVENTNEGAVGALNPLRGGGERPSKAIDTLLEHGIQLGPPPKDIKNIPLSASEQRAFQKRAGQLIEEGVAKATGSARWDATKPAVKADVLKRVVENAHAQAGGELLKGLSRDELRARQAKPAA